MRKTLHLIVILQLCLVTAAMAQKKPVEEVSYFSEDGVSYRPSYSAEYTYYPDCKEKTYTQSDLDKDSVIYFGYKLLFDYDVAGTEHRSTALDYNTTTKGYDTSYRRTTTYNTANQETSSLFENFSNGRWYPGQRDMSTYNTAGQITMKLYQDYNGSAGTFLNSSKLDYHYNGANQLMYETDSSGDYRTGVLSPFYQTYYTYDANGYQFLDSLQRWNQDTKQWEDFHVNKSYKNSRGQEDSAVWRYTDGSFSKSYNSYYPSGDYRQYTSYYYDTNYVLAGGGRYTFVQDPYRVINDSFPHNGVTIHEDLNVAADTFYITSTATDTVFYNSDSTQGEYRQSEILPDGSVTGEPTKTFYTYIDCPSTALPLSVLRFAAMLQDGNAVVNWTTANETGVSYFGVQRSVDGVTFTDIGRVASKGIDGGSNSYLYTDKNIAALAVRQVYYRLAEVLPDGSVGYSSIARIDLGNNGLSVSVSPNPVRDVINIRSSGTLMNAIVTVSDMQGHIVYMTKRNLAAGEPLQVDCSLFTRGVYVVSVRTGQVNTRYKIVK